MQITLDLEGAIRYDICHNLNVPVAQRIRAVVYGTTGRGFESLRVRKKRPANLAGRFVFRGIYCGIAPSGSGVM